MLVGAGVPDRPLGIVPIERDDVGIVPYDADLKEIRRTMRIREGEPLDTTLTLFDKFSLAIHSFVERYKKTAKG